jgi:thiosulfate reductase cytochrome b subunit
VLEKPTRYSAGLYGSRSSVRHLRRFDKYVLQTLGFGLIVIGDILLIVGIFTLGMPEHCPANGCVPGAFFWIDLMSSVTFFSGITFIAIGIVLIIVARRMKPDQ